MATVIAEVRSAKVVGIPAPESGHVRSHLHRRLRDGLLAASGSTAAILPNVLAPGLKVALFGKVEFDTYSGDLAMMHPEFEILSGDDETATPSLHTGRIVPIYEARGQDHDARVPHAAPSDSGQHCAARKIHCRRDLASD